MAVMAQMFETLLELLLSVFGQFPTPPHNPNKRATEENEDGELFEAKVDIPVSSGKMSFAAEERLIEKKQRTEIVFRLALSEEAIAAGLFEKANAWAEAAERVIRTKFPQLEKRIKIAITEIHPSGDVLPLHILTIDARKR